MARLVGETAGESVGRMDGSPAWCYAGTFEDQRWYRAYTRRSVAGRWVCAACARAPWGFSCGQRVVSATGVGVGCRTLRVESMGDALCFCYDGSGVTGPVWRCLGSTWWVPFSSFCLFTFGGCFYCRVVHSRRGMCAARGA